MVAMLHQKESAGVNAARTNIPASSLLDPDQTAELLSRYSVATPRQTYIQSSDVAAVIDACAGMQWPLVLKAVGPELVHKSDAGGVRIGLRGLEDLQNAAAGMADTISGLTG